MINKKNNDKPLTGILEWFHIDDKDHVLKAIQQLQSIGVRELRTGLSWADYHTEGGPAWLDWLIPTLAKNFNILPCLLYTPPSIGIAAKISSPPKYPEYFADFTKQMLQRYGQYFEYVELWNEPNNPSEYDYRLDTSWNIFYSLITWAAKEVRTAGKKVVLGGMSPIDPGWLGHMFEKGLMDSIDVVGVHGFPGTFDSKWEGWPKTINRIQEVLDYHKGHQKIWITETGYSTWRYDEQEQLRQFIVASSAPVERVYWYSLNELDPHRPTVDGFHLDDREYHFGMISNAGTPKLLFRNLQKHGIDKIENFSWMADQFLPIHAASQKEAVLITGGAGFIGTNLADRFLSKNVPVIIYDNLSRAGVEKNIQWLQSRHADKLKIIIGDVRDPYKLKQAVDQASFVYHFAAQVAVTTSCNNPADDLQTNIVGTFNVLEAIRNSSHRPPLAFTSTNKVYGKLTQVSLQLNGTRYFTDQEGFQSGVNESQPLDFYSPYGCSKGAADAYVLDYARIYGLKTVVFRMSCIYGPHQFGTEDQGWVAHFLIQALKGNPLMIYGDGNQVRDILYVEDLVNAFLLVKENIDRLSGAAYNIGGGYKNSISLNELIILIEEMTDKKIKCSYSGWRAGDQKYYISDTRKFNMKTRWKQQYSVQEGIQLLYNWLGESMLEKKVPRAMAAGV